MPAAVRALREKLGDDAMGGLQTFVDDAGHKWKDDVLGIAAERFDRRLSEEVGALRLDMVKEFATLRTEMATSRFEMLKWAFVFWIGQFAAVSAMMTFLLRTIRTP